MSKLWWEFESEGFVVVVVGYRRADGWMIVDASSKPDQANRIIRLEMVHLIGACPLFLAIKATGWKHSASEGAKQDGDEN